MTDMLPLATYTLNVEPYTPVPAIDVTMPITIRITMAALNPEAIDEDNKPSTLRIIKRNPNFEDDDDFLGGDFDEDEMDDESPAEEEEEEEEEEKTDKKKKNKGKKVESESESESDEDGEDEDEDDEFQESVLLTLSLEGQCQQSLDLTIAPEEEVQFIVTGSYAISLSGNYIKHPFDTPMGVDDDDEDEEDIYDSDEYDLTPDEDEIISDNLDDLDDEEEEEVRIEEVEEEEEEEEEEEPKPEPKKTKKEKKRKHEEKEEEKKAKKVKKVEFKKDLEEGPTKPKSKKEQDNKQKPKTKVLEGGIVVEDRAVGDGPQAKRGARVGMRYIGKLKNGKVFDKNTSGKPFAFKLGRGEVIKGWDIGVAGMCVGSERRIVIPAPYAYGSQALPGIPANSELTFDVKLVSLKN